MIAFEHLTEEEHEALAVYDNGRYFCVCAQEVCPSIPCENDRHDLTRVVERILAARLAEQREQIVQAIQEAKPPHATRDYTPVDQAYNNAARIARGEK